VTDGCQVNGLSKGTVNTDNLSWCTLVISLQWNWEKNMLRQMTKTQA